MQGSPPAKHDAVRGDTLARVKLGATLWPQNTTWADMLAVWREADQIELYESGWTFDHFYPIRGDATGPCLEGWVTLTALAQATTRLRLGNLVSGYAFENGTIFTPNFNHLLRGCTLPSAVGPTSPILHVTMPSAFSLALSISPMMYRASGRS